MAGDTIGPCADEGADQAVQCNVAAACQARLFGRCGACLSGGVAGREDDQVGVEVKVEDFLECQQAVRSGAAEAGQQRRLSRALRGAGGHDAMGCEVEDAVLVEIVARLQRRCR